MSGRRRRHRRVVELSEADRRRLAEEQPEPELDALAQHVPPVRASEDTDVAWGERGDPDDDERLRRDVPPHWA